MKQQQDKMKHSGLRVRNALACAAAVAALWAGVAAHSADTRLTRPIKIIVPVAAGSATDLTARQLAPPLAQELGQQVGIVPQTKAGALLPLSVVGEARSPL